MGKSLMCCFLTHGVYFFGRKLNMMKFLFRRTPPIFSGYRAPLSTQAANYGHDL